MTIDFATGVLLPPRGARAARRHVARRRGLRDRRCPRRPSGARPRVARAAIRGGWSGLYEMTPDHNALIGEARTCSRFLYATGFSGHGFLQAPAVGEVLRDLVLGRPPVRRRRAAERRALRRPTPIARSSMSSDTAASVSNRNPADLDEVVCTIGLASPGRAARRRSPAARAQSSWAATPAPVRGQIVANIAQLFAANKEALARIITREIGKPYAEALGEVQEVVDTAQFFLGEGRRLYGQTVPSEMRDKQLFTFRVPVGMSVIITAGNFPMAVPSWYIVPALLCGNTVLWKPAEYAAAAPTPSPRSSAARGCRRRRSRRARAGRRRFRGARRRARAGARRQGRVHGLGRRRAADRRAVRAPPPVAVPRARRQEPARRDGRRRPGAGRRGSAVQRLRDGGPAVHLAGDGDRARVASTTSSSSASSPRPRRPRSATRWATS